MDGREQHITLPESLSPIPEPAPTHILLNEEGEVMAYAFRGSSVNMSLDPSDVVMALDPETPEECPVYRQTRDRSNFTLE